MKTDDIILLTGQLFGMWSLGFVGGYLIQVFKKAVNQAV